MKAEPLDLVRIFQADIWYVVPIFQRRYVWSQEDQWEGLWEDLTDGVGSYRRSEQLKMMEPQAPVVVPTHFLGAIVLDQAFAGTGRIDASLVIDGQQRLTTLRVILAALRSVAEETGDDKQARLVARLFSNDPDLVYFSRPFRDRLARKAEQTPDPTIAEALRLLVKRWDEEGEPVLGEEDGSTGRAA